MGADAQFHELALKLRVEQNPAQINGHPSDLAARYQFDGRCDSMETPKPPLDRNRDIVNAADIMFAAPAEMEEVRRSGTWATVRFAQKSGKPLCIVWPDGSNTWENEVK